MTYTIRPGFTITLPSGTFTGGQEVELTPEEFEANRHKLEGVGSNLPDINPGSNDASSDCCDAPVVSEISPTRLFIGFEAKLTIRGSFFRPSMTVEIDGVTVDSVDFKSDNLVEVNITVGSETQFSNVTLDNGKQLVVENAIELLDPEDSIIDLRSGGTEFSDNAIEVRSGMSWERTADGLIFRGLRVWGSWARFPGDNDAWTWNRDQKREVSLIFTHTNERFMGGIGSRANAPNNNAQYTQAEILGFFASQTSFNGFFGNSGNPGNLANQSVTAAISSNAVKKLTFTSNGEPGSTASLYELPNSDIGNWASTSNLRGSWQIAANMSADEPEIMPFVIPPDGDSVLFLGLII